MPVTAAPETAQGRRRLGVKETALRVKCVPTTAASKLGFS